MELLQPLRQRNERKIEQRINDVTDHLSSTMITHLASQAVGDLHVFVGQVPRAITPAEFIERVEDRTYRAIESRAPHFAGQLAISAERTRQASTENVRIGNHGWRNDIKAEGVTIVVTSAESLIAA
jgi:hypothetical protein